MCFKCPADIEDSQLILCSCNSKLQFELSGEAPLLIVILTYSKEELTLNSITLRIEACRVILLFSVDQYPKSSVRRLASAVKGPRTLRGTPSAGRLEYEGGFSLFYCGFGSGPVDPHWPAAEPDESASGPC